MRFFAGIRKRKHYGKTFPKGASDQVINTGREFVQANGAGSLLNVT
jgi:ribonuclease HIII